MSVVGSDVPFCASERLPSAAATGDSGLEQRIATLDGPVCRMERRQVALAPALRARTRLDVNLCGLPNDTGRIRSAQFAGRRPIARRIARRTAKPEHTIPYRHGIAIYKDAKEEKE